MKKKRKNHGVYTSFQEKFPGKKTRCCGDEGAHISGLARFFFSLGSHATIKERNFPVVARGRHGSSARDALWRRARAWTLRMFQLNFLVSLSSAAQFACPTATLVAFHLTILSTKLRPVGDAEKAGRKRNGRRRGEGETEMETRRATDCSNRVYEVPVDRKARGHVARREEEGERRYLTVCDSNNEGSLEVHSTDVLSWAKLMRFLFLQFRCFVLDPVLTSSPWTPKVTFLFVTEITEENIECMCG